MRTLFPFSRKIYLTLSGLVNMKSGGMMTVLQMVELMKCGCGSCGNRLVITLTEEMVLIIMA